MTYSLHQRDLDKALESEVLGELLFQTAAAHANQPEQQEKWLLLARLETQTLHKLQDFLQQNGWQASVSAMTRLGARASGVALGRMPWGLAMRLLRQGTGPFMRTFERMHAHADVQTRGFLAYLLAHEQALAEFARREIEEAGRDALAPVRALLED